MLIFKLVILLKASVPRLHPGIRSGLTLHPRAVFLPAHSFRSMSLAAL
jgi:hypothetical protein